VEIHRPRRRDVDHLMLFVAEAAAAREKADAGQHDDRWRQKTPEASK
jgi:hypothetical protein